MGVQLYHFGDYVFSKQVGPKESFIGRVTYVCRNLKNDVYYHVVDDEGAYWHRLEEDLSPGKAVFGSVAEL